MSNAKKTIAALNQIGEKLENIHSVLSVIADNTWKTPRDEAERRSKVFEEWLRKNSSEKLGEYFESKEYLEMKDAFEEHP